MINNNNNNFEQNSDSALDLSALDMSAYISTVLAGAGLSSKVAAIKSARPVYKCATCGCTFTPDNLKTKRFCSAGCRNNCPRPA